MKQTDDLDQELDPQMALALREQQDLPPAQALTLSTSPDVVAQLRNSYRRERAYWNADAPPVSEVRDDFVPGRYGNIPVRIYYSHFRQPLPVLVYLHGGGWVVGDLNTHDKIMRRLALDAGVAVVGIDYRLAPEYKLPVQLEECLTVIEYIIAGGGAERWQLNSDKLAVGGDSAGAHLSLGISLELAKKNQSMLAASLLFYGSYGLQDSASMRRYGGDDRYGLSRADMDFYRDCLLRSPADYRDSRYDLLSADIGQLPPQYIVAAELDPLRDDSMALAALLGDANIEHELIVYPGVLHGFLHLSRTLEKADQCLRDAAHWLRLQHES